MSSWRPALCLNVLREQVDAAFPDRPQAADGMIGDTRHQATKSDHNPNASGVVTAWDITTDDRFTDSLAEQLRRLGASGDGRIKYVIFKGRIAGPAKRGWAWRTYVGFSQHYDHIHLSVAALPKQYDRTDRWPVVFDMGGSKGTSAPVLPAKPATPDSADWDEMASKEEIRAVVAEEVAKAVKQLHNDHVVLLRGSAQHPFNLTAIAQKLGIR